MNASYPSRLNRITGDIVDAAMKVHTALGPGLLESAYKTCLAYELRKRELNLRMEVPLTLTYDGVEIDAAYRLDMVIERLVVVEIKAATQLHPVHQAQLLSYLKLGGFPAGLLINFHARHLRDGITRMVNSKR
jgi:GxxExxY protein